MGTLLPTLLFVAALCGSPEADGSSQPVTIHCTPLMLNPADPEQRQVGRLRFRAGFRLRADRREFGGFSGMALFGEGRWLTAVSDRGRWLVAELRHTADGTLQGIGGAHLGPLRDTEGNALPGCKGRDDAEDLAALSGGDLIVSFEGEHRLATYPRDGDPPGLSGTPRPLPHPAEIAGAQSNGGMEAVTELAGGGLLVLSEELQFEFRAD